MKLKLKNKYLVIGVGAIILILVLILLIGQIKLNGTDGAKFKKDYEALNGEVASGDNTYQKLKIDKKNKVKSVSLKEAYEILSEGTGLVYFGYPKCPWCRGILPGLLDAVDCSCLENLYYVDMTGLRDEFEYKDGEVVKTKEAKDEYYKLLELLDKYLDEYNVKDDEGLEHTAPNKRIMVPLVVGSKDGYVKGVFDGVELDEDQSPYDELTDTQNSEVKILINNLIDEITKEDAVCDEHC